VAVAVAVAVSVSVSVSVCKHACERTCIHAYKHNGACYSSHVREQMYFFVAKPYRLQVVDSLKLCIFCRM